MSSRRKWAAWNGSTRSHTDKYKITNKQIHIKDHAHTNKEKITHKYNYKITHR